MLLEINAHCRPDVLFFTAHTLTGQGFQIPAMRRGRRQNPPLQPRKRFLAFLLGQTCCSPAWVGVATQPGLPIRPRRAEATRRGKYGVMLAAGLFSCGATLPDSVGCEPQILILAIFNNVSSLHFLSTLPQGWNNSD